MMISAKQRLYTRLAVRMAPRFRWRIWQNFVRYHLTVARAQSAGADTLLYTPPSVAIWVTNRCNKDCHFCQYSEGLNAKNHRELELTFDRFKQLVHLPIARNCVRLALYGGEPLLNQALPEMIAYGKQQGHLVTVNTNGLLIKKRLPALLDSKPDLLSISYYPEDREKTDEAIALAAPHIPVTLHYMYSEARLADLEEVVECAVRNRVWAVMFETYDVQGTRDDCELPGKTAPAHSQRREQEVPIQADDPRLVKLKRELHARYGEKLWMIWPQPAPPHNGERRATCRTFWHSTWLDAKGQMSPCCVWPVAAFEGDVMDGTAAWNSPRMTLLRASMRRNVYPRICSTCSHLDGDLLGI